MQLAIPMQEYECEETYKADSYTDKLFGQPVFPSSPPSLSACCENQRQVLVSQIHAPSHITMERILYLFTCLSCEEWWFV
jgi:hypothetical protein